MVSGIGPLPLVRNASLRSSGARWCPGTCTHAQPPRFTLGCSNVQGLLEPIALPLSSCHCFAGNGRKGDCLKVFGLAAAATLLVGATQPFSAAQPSRLGQGGGQPLGSTSSSVVVGWGNASGYRLDLLAEGAPPHEVALLRPVADSGPPWSGYQCLSRDGRYAAVTVAAASAANSPEARAHGAFAYAVDLSTGNVTPLASGVSLYYYSPGCGVGDSAVFTSRPNADASTTRLLRVDLRTGRWLSNQTVRGQLTSAVPVTGGIAAIRQGRLGGVAHGSRRGHGKGRLCVSSGAATGRITVLQDRRSHRAAVHTLRNRTGGRHEGHAAAGSLPCDRGPLVVVVSTTTRALDCNRGRRPRRDPTRYLPEAGSSSAERVYALDVQRPTAGLHAKRRREGHLTCRAFRCADRYQHIALRHPRNDPTRQALQPE